MLALQTINEVHAKGGLVRRFQSYCGALPAPECAANPLGYKFSWSPRGVLLALKNEAKFYQDGAIRSVSVGSLLNEVEDVGGLGLSGLVAYPNRDATAYRDMYRVLEAETIIRNTLRYPQFISVVKALSDIGMLSQEEKDYLDPATGPLSWKCCMKEVLRAPSSDVR